MKETNTHLKLLCFIVFLLCLSCSKDRSGTKKYPNVDARLWRYFDQFEQEAAIRGHNIDLKSKGLYGEIENIYRHETVGLCSHQENQPNQLIIDNHFWERANNTKKEMIVFHELGHCILDKPHNNRVNSDGTCYSIMRSGSGVCLDLYNQASREKYLNELFE